MQTHTCLAIYAASCNNLPKLKMPCSVVVKRAQHITTVKRVIEMIRGKFGLQAQTLPTIYATCCKNRHYVTTYWNIVVESAQGDATLKKRTEMLRRPVRKFFFSKVKLALTFMRHSARYYTRVAKDMLQFVSK